VKAIVLCVIFLAVTAGCASPPELEGEPWSNFAYSRLSDKLLELAGPAPDDCGYYDLVDTKQLPSMNVYANNCIKEAVKAGRSFKFASMDINHDLYLYDAVVFSPDKGFWLIEYGVLVDASDAHLQVEKCRTVDIEFNPIFYNRSECQAIDATNWMQANPD
jgi:hypothetical protein